MKLGISGWLTKTFIQSPLTPLLLLASIAVGALALAVLPREEEPQISVPMVDVVVQTNGLSAQDGAELVTKPLEDIVRGIDNVEHVYSVTEDDNVIVTVRFDVGHDPDRAILRVHEQIRANMHRIPIGIPEPLIIGKGINDVPIMVLVLTPKSSDVKRWNDNNLFEVAEELQHELRKVPDVGRTFIAGGRATQIRIEPDPERLSLYGIALNQLVEKVRNANRAFAVGSLRQADRALPVVAGQTLKGGKDISLLLITSYDGRPVYLQDVANVVHGSDQVDHRSWHLSPDESGALQKRPAVSLALAKRQGSNAVAIADGLLAQLERIKGRLVPDGIDIVVARNYGETAREKADELLFHLVLASVSIVALLTLFLGWREGVVVLVVIPTTILLTFFAAWLMDYTINRVSMFALIFSIGILVDDAIVVVENIDRHWRKQGMKNALQTAINAVAEVGNPTIIATFTIIAALLPMLFVSGLMGPYMSPIPVNASAAMLFSLFVAMVITPWLMFRLRHKPKPGESETASGSDHEEIGLLGRAYLSVATPLLQGRARSKMFLLVVTVLTFASLVLFYTQDVVVKLLPFDNKSEFSLVLDMPRGASLEHTERILMAAAGRLEGLPELIDAQAYVGTAAPFNFNGLVRHYYFRTRPDQAELQINLKAKHDRDRASHDIALDVRERLADLKLPEGSALKVVEVPPGPPVMATLLAEVYGPDDKSRRETAQKLKEAFSAVPFVVDIDDSWGEPNTRVRYSIDQESLEWHQVEEEAVYDTLAALLGGMSVGYSHQGGGTNPVGIVVALPRKHLTPSEYLLATPVPTRKGGWVELGDVVKMSEEAASYPLYRRDGRFAEMVMAEMAGSFEAPIYGMIAVQEQIEKMSWPHGMPQVHLNGQPTDESVVSVLWDGEWEITWVTFRDMGGAFIVAILGIYLLVVAQFGSFKVPLVVLVPVPLTLIGIMLGHWLFSAAFTATSMIGFIALAGIVVRNSILLIDFIRARQNSGLPIRKVLLDAGAIRFKPIFLTALAAMLGASVILADPIFQGLAISMLFGLASSTALTLLVIPAIYVWLRDDHRTSD
jgi:multidrug efflux pump subunit AcrB